MPTQLLTVREVAEQIQKSEFTVRQKLRQGVIRGVQETPRSPWRVTQKALDHYVTRNTR